MSREKKHAWGFNPFSVIPLLLTAVLFMVLHGLNGWTIDWPHTILYVIFACCVTVFVMRIRAEHLVLRKQAVIDEFKRMARRASMELLNGGVPYKEIYDEDGALKPDWNHFRLATLVRALMMGIPLEKRETVTFEALELLLLDAWNSARMSRDLMTVRGTVLPRLREVLETPRKLGKGKGADSVLAVIAEAVRGLEQLMNDCDPGELLDMVESEMTRPFDKLREGLNLVAPPKEA